MPQLAEKDRTRLDSILVEMQSKGASDDEMRVIANDFISKYSAASRRSSIAHEDTAANRAPLAPMNPFGGFAPAPSTGGRSGTQMGVLGTRSLKQGPPVAPARPAGFIRPPLAPKQGPPQYIPEAPVAKAIRGYAGPKEQARRLAEYKSGKNRMSAMDVARMANEDTENLVRAATTAFQITAPPGIVGKIGATIGGTLVGGTLALPSNIIADVGVAMDPRSSGEEHLRAIGNLALMLFPVQTGKALLKGAAVATDALVTAMASRNTANIRRAFIETRRAGANPQALNKLLQVLPAETKAGLNDLWDLTPGAATKPKPTPKRRTPAKAPASPADELTPPVAGPKSVSAMSYDEIVAEIDAFDRPSKTPRSPEEIARVNAVKDELRERGPRFTTPVKRRDVVSDSPTPEPKAPVGSTAAGKERWDIRERTTKAGKPYFDLIAEDGATVAGDPNRQWVEANAERLISEFNQRAKEAAEHATLRKDWKRSSQLADLERETTVAMWRRALSLDDSYFASIDEGPNWGRGYQDYSQSTNAAAARSRGAMTPTEMARQLGRESPYLKGLTARDIEEILPYAEHHTSKFYNRTKMVERGSVGEALPELVERAAERRDLASLMKEAKKEGLTGVIGGYVESTYAPDVQASRLRNALKVATGRDYPEPKTPTLLDVQPLAGESIDPKSLRDLVENRAIMGSEVAGKPARAGAPEQKSALGGNAQRSDTQGAGLADSDAGVSVSAPPPKAPPVAKKPVTVPETASRPLQKTPKIVIASKPAKPPMAAGEKGRVDAAISRLDAEIAALEAKTKPKGPKPTKLTGGTAKLSSDDFELLAKRIARYSLKEYKTVAEGIAEFASHIPEYANRLRVRVASILSKEGIAEPPKRNVEIKHEATEALREEIDIPAYQRDPTLRSKISTKAKADTKGQAQVERTVESEVIPGTRNLNEYEQELAARQFANLLVERDEIAGRLAKAATDEEKASWSAKSDAITKRIHNLAEGLDRTGSSWSRMGVSRRLLKRNASSRQQLYLDIEQAIRNRNVKGKSTFRKRAEDLGDELETMVKYREGLEAKIGDAAVETEVRAARKGAKADGTLEGALSSARKAKTDIEFNHAVRRVARKIVERNPKITLEELYAELMDEIPGRGLDPQSIRRIMGRLDDPRGSKTATEAQKRFQVLTNEASLTERIADALDGKFPEGVTKASEEAYIKDLRRRLKEVVKQGKLEKGIEPQQIRLRGKLQKALEILEGRAAKDPKKVRPADPKEIADLKASLAELNKQINARERIAQLEYEIRTGDFSTPKAKAPESPEMTKLRAKERTLQAKRNALLEEAGGKPWWEWGFEVGNWDRPVQSSLDDSGLGRQNLVLLMRALRQGRFKDVGNTVLQSLKLLGSKNPDELAATIQNHIEGRWSYDEALKAKLNLSDPMLGGGSEFFHGSLIKRATQAMAQSKIPGIRQLGQATKSLLDRSEHAMVGMGNLFRSNDFENYLIHAPSAPDDAKAIFGEYLNTISGLPKMGEILPGSKSIGARLARQFIYATKFAWSRWKSPTYLLKTGAIGKEARKDFLTTAGFVYGSMKAGEAAGLWEVDSNPASGNFLKIKIGNTRYDPWGGFLGPARIGLRSLNALFGYAFFDDEKFSDKREILNVLTQQAAYKLSPAANRLLWIPTKEYGMEKDVPWQTMAYGRSAPLWIQDAMEIVENDDARLASFISPFVFFGGGATSYQDDSNFLKLSPAERQFYIDKKVKKAKEKIPGLIQGMPQKIEKAKEKTREMAGSR